MTAHHRLDRLREDPPPGLDDRNWRHVDLETDETDAIYDMQAKGLRNGNGEIYAIHLFFCDKDGVKVGDGVTLSEAQAFSLFGPEHFERINSLDPMKLNELRQDWLDSMEDDRE